MQISDAVERKLHEKAKQTTQEERLRIVQDCLANDKVQCNGTKSHNCSYQQVRNWVLRYEKMGVPDWKTGVVDVSYDRRGLKKPHGTKLQELERKNRYLQMRMTY